MATATAVNDDNKRRIGDIVAMETSQGFAQDKTRRGTGQRP